MQHMIGALLALCWRGAEMASILFVTWDGGGNVPPALGIAAELHEASRCGSLGMSSSAA